MSNDWAAPTDLETVRRRSGGRRSYNARRAFLRDHRRVQVARRLRGYGPGAAPFGRGLQARIARELDVAPSTICRDVRALVEAWRAARACPTCGTLLLRAGGEADVAEGQFPSGASAQG